MCQCGLAASVLGRPLDAPCAAVGSFGNALVMIRATVRAGQGGSVSTHCSSAFQRASTSDGIHNPNSCPLDPLVDLRMDCPGLVTHSFLLNHFLCIHSLQKLLALAILTPLEGVCSTVCTQSVSVSAARAQQLDLGLAVTTRSLWGCFLLGSLFPASALQALSQWMNPSAPLREHLGVQRDPLRRGTPMLSLVMSTKPWTSPLGSWK